MIRMELESHSSELDDLALRGGRPTRKAPWPTYDKGNVMVDGDEVEAAIRVLKRRLLFRYDQRPLAETEVGRFEHALCKFFGSKHALSVSWR